VLYLLHPAGRSPAAAGGVAAAPLELTFQEQYGAMQRHLWFGDGFVMVGFRTGRIVVVSSARWGGGYEGGRRDGKRAWKRDPKCG
jgi:hypothetical protein